MDSEINVQILILKNDEVLITRIEEVLVDIGNPIAIPPYKIWVNMKQICSQERLP